MSVSLWFFDGIGDFLEYDVLPVAEGQLTAETTLRKFRENWELYDAEAKDIGDVPQTWESFLGEFGKAVTDARPKLADAFDALEAELRAAVVVAASEPEVAGSGEADA